jgi:hypothetical protein
LLHSHSTGGNLFPPRETLLLTCHVDAVLVPIRHVYKSLLFNPSQWI